MKKIVVVDDNQPAADGIARLLKVLGYDTKALYSGADLITHLGSNEADLVIIDIGMPEMDGYTTVRTMRTQGYELPAVALSGYGQDEDKAKASTAGFTAHLIKPVGAAELRAMIEALLPKD